MTEWQIWSSEDLVHWVRERRIFPADFYCGPIDQCWAVDAHEKNGKYYWYFSVGSNEVGVGIGDHPAGPFTDALHHALADAKTHPENIAKWDPCCFEDDDGQCYLVCGTVKSPPPYDAYLIAKLNDDMVTLAEDFRVMDYPDNPNPEDKPNLHKHGGLYYLSHASYYATSKSVYGPYTYRGNFGANLDHGSFFSWNGQDYFASGGMDNENRFYRASYLCYVHYRKNGEIVVDQTIMGYGVGEYEACWDTIEAEWYSAADGTEKLEEPDGSFSVAALHAGATLSYPNVHHMQADTPIAVRVSSGRKEGAVLCVHEDGPDGTLLGRIVVPYTGGWDRYKTIAGRLKNAPGTHTLFFVFEGGDEKLLHLDSFSLEDGKTSRYCAQASLGALTDGAQRQEDRFATGGFCAAGLSKPDDSVTLALDGFDGGEAELAFIYANGADVPCAARLYIDGQPVSPISFAPTGSDAISPTPHEKRVSVHVHPGVCTITLRGDNAQGTASLSLESVTLIKRKTPYRSYPLADAELYPKGNGCFMDCPQRENDPYAFSGRIANYLLDPRTSVILDKVFAGEEGEHLLQIRYAALDKTVFSLYINDKPYAHLTFEPTGSNYMDKPGIVTAQAVMKAGFNKVELRKTDGTHARLNLDAITVLKIERGSEFKTQK